MVTSLSRRRRARQFFVLLGFSPWVVSGIFCVFRSGFFSLDCFWCFLNFKVRVWGVSCLIGLGMLVPAFFFVLPIPPLSAGLGVVPFVCLFVFLCFFPPSCRSPHSVLGHGLGNRAAILRHGTVVFSCSFLFSSCRRPPQPRAGGRPG